MSIPYPYTCYSLTLCGKVTLPPMIYLFIDIDRYRSSPCKNGATCHDAVDKYTCMCSLGYTGTTCQTGQWVDDNVL